MSSSPFVVLTRELEDNLPLARALTERGVPVRELPCLRTRYLEPVHVPGAVAAVAFASRRAVRGFHQAGLVDAVLRREHPPLVAAVGQATRAELESHGVAVELVADPPTGRSLAALLHRRLGRDQLLLVPRGELAGGGLEPGLRELGCAFHSLVVYAQEAPEAGALAPFPVAAVFVAAPSAAARLIERAPWLKDHPILAIGPTTAEALEALGATRILGPAMSLEQQAQILEGLWREHPRRPSANPLNQR